jgi:hypothetical protein
MLLLLRLESARGKKGSGLRKRKKKNRRMKAGRGAREKESKINYLE